MDTPLEPRAATVGWAPSHRIRGSSGGGGTASRTGFTHKAERRVQWRAGGLARPLRRPRLPQGPPHAVPSTTGSALSYPHSLLLTCFSIAGPPSWENVRPRGIQECASSGLPCPSSWWAPRGTREPSDTLRRRPPDAHRALQRDGAEAAWAEAVRL